MKRINKSGLIVFGLLALAACQKVGDLPLYKSGTTSVLSSSSATFAPAAADSSKPAITFLWTNPGYATDSAKNKYIIEIDSAGRNFAKAASKVVTGALSTSFTAKEFNTILLGFGFEFGKPYDVDVRLITSYGNNNDRIIANTVKLKATPYKIPPKVALPTTNRLFITGGATEFDWTNPATMPSVRELTRLEETKWGAIFKFSGTGNYLLLQQGGNWDDKYSVANKSLAGLSNGGSFGFKLSDDFPASFSGGAGWYKMIYDFQTGTFAATKEANALATDLYATGDGTASSWTNTPPATQKFTQVTNGLFEITLPLQPGKFLKFLSASGNWQPQFGGSSATGGTIGANYGGGTDPDSVPTPAVAGNYKIQVNFITGKYTLTKV